MTSFSVNKWNVFLILVSSSYLNNFYEARIYRIHYIQRWETNHIYFINNDELAILPEKFISDEKSFHCRCFTGFFYMMDPVNIEL